VRWQGSRSRFSFQFNQKTRIKPNGIANKNKPKKSNPPPEIEKRSAAKVGNDIEL